MNDKTNNPKTDSPASDETARAKHAYAGDEAMADVSDDIDGLQTSNKSGKHSSVQKLAASRPEFGTGRGAQQVSGAFGDDPNHQITGRNAQPDMNHFRCRGCGRYFDTAETLSDHETECLLAKAATPSGAKSIADAE